MDAAQSDFRRALLFRPKELRDYNAHGHVLCKLGRAQEAVVAFDAAIERSRYVGE